MDRKEAEARSPPTDPKGGADRMDVHVVVENADHTKETLYRKAAPIDISSPGTPYRFCSIDFELLQPVISVLGVDAEETNATGEIIVRHAFR